MSWGIFFAEYKICGRAFPAAPARVLFIHACAVRDQVASLRCASGLCSELSANALLNVERNQRKSECGQLTLRKTLSDLIIVAPILRHINC